MEKRKKKITLLFVFLITACFTFIVHAADQAAVYPKDKRLSANIIIDGQVTDWYNIKYLYSEGKRFYSALDDNRLAFYFYTNVKEETYTFYIDADLDSSTGYQSTNWGQSGFEYMVKENELFAFDETLSQWTRVCTIQKITNSRIREFSIPLFCLNLLEPADMRMAIESDTGMYYPSPEKELIPVNTYITGTPDFLTPPKNLRLYTDKTTVRLEWDDVPGAYGYEVYFNGKLFDIQTAASFEQENLRYGRRYSIQVRSVGEKMVSCWSSYVYSKLVDGQAPEIPANLKTTEVTFNSAGLVWDSALDNVGTAGYLVYRDGTFIAAVNEASFEEKSLSPATLYSYSVASYDLAGNISERSQPLEVVTLEEPEDATIRLEDGSGGDVVDAFLNPGSPDTNYGQTHYLSSFDHFPIRFTLPDELAGREIIEAKLAFYVWNQTNYQSDQYLDLFLIESPWEEDGVTWNSTTSSTNWNTPGGDLGELVGRIPHQEGREKWDHTFYPEIDVTRAVRDWVNGTVSNNGFMLVNDSVTSIGLKASEYSAGKRPYLTITYALKNDTEPPKAPKNLKAEVLSESAISLSWSPATDNTGVTGYTLYRNDLEIAGLTALFYTDSGLNADTLYTYTVCAFDKTGNVSGHSVPVTVRTLPLPVETTVRLENSGFEVEDAFLESASPDTNYGPTLYKGSFDNFAIKFGFSPALFQKTIVSAKIAFYVWNQTNYQSEQYLDLYRINRSWSEAGITWNNADNGTAWTTPGGDLGELVGRILHQEGSENWDHTFYPETDVTPVVREWINRTEKNNGFMLVNNSATRIGLKASEYRTGRRPYLLVTYRYYPVEDTQSPELPAGLTGQALSDSRITLNWTSSTDNFRVTGYKIFRDGIEAGITGETTFTDAGLVPDTAYSYTVAAFDYNGNMSDQSDSITIRTEGSGTVYYSLNITASGGRVTKSPDQAEYEAGTAVILTAEANENYTFQSWSGDYTGTENPVTIGMDSNKNITALFSQVQDTSPPTIPSGLETALISHNRIDIRWNASQDNNGVAGYRIYRDDSLIATAGTLYYSDSSLAPDRTYRYGISAFDPSGNESALSEILSVTTKTEPVTDSVIINHTSCDITLVPQSAIENAKNNLIIAYGHTSHGSQITTGMNGLVGFMNGKGYPENLYAWNSSGSGGALQLRDTPFSGASDLGNPNRTAWATATRNYLNSHTEVNVIMWSWCGQASNASEADMNTYLTLMSGLEEEFPAVKFVYMTGHLDGSGQTGNLNVRNRQIRDYCETNDKILYDFADIESYDPEGTVNYMVLGANDNCYYDSDGNGSKDKNWALDWQNSHIRDVDWYSCGSAHSQDLNANRKAYAAWHLFARLAGWSPGN